MIANPEDFIMDVETVDPNSVDLPPEIVATLKKTQKKETELFARIPFDELEKLQCRGVYIFYALCILHRVERTVWKKIKVETRPWFFVSTKFWKSHEIPENSWYESVNKLINYGIIKKRQGAGPASRNLYAFTRKLEGDE